MSAAAAARPTPKGKQPPAFERRVKGFTPIPHEAMYELPRLAGGLVQYVCVQYVLSLTLGADRDPKTPPPERSRPLSVEEFAWVTHEKDVRTVQYALKDLCERKVLVREYAGRRGFYRYSAPIPTWSGLTDYAEVKKKAAQIAMELDSAAEAEDDQTEETGEETANVQRRQFRRTKVQANVPTKPIELDDLPERVQFQCSGAATIQHGIEEGLLIVRVKVVELSKRKAKPNGADLAALSNGVSNDTNGHALPSSYDVHFRVAWAEAGLSGSDWDHEQAEEFWKDLEIVDQMKAVESVRKRKAAGEFDDPQYHFLPQNYFKKGVWQRAVRERKKNAIQEIFDRI